MEAVFGEQGQLEHVSNTENSLLAQSLLEGHSPKATVRVVCCIFGGLWQAEEEEHCFPVCFLQDAEYLDELIPS